MKKLIEDDQKEETVVLNTEEVKASRLRRVINKFRTLLNRNN
jgi:mevalonate pyrophosphate decarboxylase